MRIALFAAVAVAALALVVPARAQSNIKVGELHCNVASGLGMIITSSHTMGCTFTSSQGSSEQYMGTIRKFGLDIGVTDHGVLAWAVFAPDRRHAPSCAGGRLHRGRRVGDSGRRARRQRAGWRLRALDCVAALFGRGANRAGAVGGRRLDDVTIEAPSLTPSPSG